VTGLAIDIGASKMAVGLVSEDGEILSQETIPSLVDAGSEALYGSLHEALGARDQSTAMKARYPLSILHLGEPFRCAIAWLKISR
jgi:predicted NBD/HSP70 family sugar kinase